MDDSTPSTDHRSTQRTPLGMSSFGKDDQQQFGQNIQSLSTWPCHCVPEMLSQEGTAEPVEPNVNWAMKPSNATDIRQRLKVLSQDITVKQSSLADQIELLVRRFDDLQGCQHWKSSGAMAESLRRMDERAEFNTTTRASA